jgi:hypothetical protein
LILANSTFAVHPTRFWQLHIRCSSNSILATPLLLFIHIHEVLPYCDVHTCSFATSHLAVRLLIIMHYCPSPHILQCSAS